MYEAFENTSGYFFNSYFLWLSCGWKNWIQIKVMFDLLHHFLKNILISLCKIAYKEQNKREKGSSMTVLSFWKRILFGVNYATTMQFSQNGLYWLFRLLDTVMFYFQFNCFVWILPVFAIIIVVYQESFCYYINT